MSHNRIFIHEAIAATQTALAALGNIAYEKLPSAETSNDLHTAMLMIVRAQCLLRAAEAGQDSPPDVQRHLPLQIGI